MPVSLDDMLKEIPADRRAAIERHAEKIVSDNRSRSETPSIDADAQPAGRSAAIGGSSQDTRVADRKNR